MVASPYFPPSNHHIFKAAFAFDGVVGLMDTMLQSLEAEKLHWASVIKTTTNIHNSIVSSSSDLINQHSSTPWSQ